MSCDDGGVNASLGGGRLNLERTLDKRRRKVGVVRRRELKGYHFAEGDD